MTRLIIAYRNHRGAVRTAAIVVLIFAVLALSWLTMYPREAQALPQAPSSSSLAVALIQSGLDAKALCAAGVTPGTVASVVENVRDQMTESPGALDSAYQSLGSARAQHSQLERLIQSGLGSPQDTSAFAVASSSLSSAQAGVNGTLNSLFTEGGSGLSTGQRTILSTIRANRAAGWTHPVEYLTVTRTQPQWLDLREALAAERIAQASGGSISAEAQSILAAARSDSTVSIAITSLQASLAATESAWTSALTLTPQ
jgi:hypothetical protein